MNPENKHLWTKRKLISRLIKAVGVLFILYILGFVALYFYYRNKIFGDYSISRKEAFEKWKTEKLFFPEEALEAEPFSDETIKAAKEFYVEWKQYEKEALYLSKNFKSLVEPDAKPSTPSAEMEMFFRDFDKIFPEKEEKKKLLPPPKSILELLPQVQKIDPLIEAYGKIVSQPDYEMDAFAEGIDPAKEHDFPDPDFLPIQILSNLIWLKSLSLINEEDFHSALYYTSLNFKASKAHPYSSVISRLIGIAVLKSAVKNMNKLIHECNDREILQSALNLQKQSLTNPTLIREYAFPSTDWLGNIRFAKRKGIDVRIQGLTAQEIFIEWVRIRESYKEHCVLPHVKDEEIRKEIMESARINRKHYNTLSGKTSITRGFFMGFIVPMISTKIFSVIPVPDYNEAHNRENYVKSLLDLLSIETASKLYQIDRGAPPGSLNDLVPGYLEKEPLDRFQEKTPYLFKEHFYSIGPDHIDQYGSIPYDPTNGALSSGDIFLY